MLSDILSQVADRQKRVVVDFEKGGFNLGLVSQSADLNQYELLKTAGRLPITSILDLKRSERVRSF